MTHHANTDPRPVLRILAAMGWMCLIFLISAQRTVPQPPGITPAITSNLGHFSVYFVLAILIWWVLEGFGLEGRRRWLLAFGLTVLYGLSDEWHQSYVPGRQPDILDVMVDALGAACGLGVVRWIQGRWDTRQSPPDRQEPLLSDRAVGQE